MISNAERYRETNASFRRSPLASCAQHNFFRDAPHASVSSGPHRVGPSPPPRKSSRSLGRPNISPRAPARKRDRRTRHPTNRLAVASPPCCHCSRKKNSRRLRSNSAPHNRTPSRNSNQSSRFLFSRRNAKASPAAHRRVRRLQTAPLSDDFRSLAQRHLLPASVASRWHHASQSPRPNVRQAHFIRSRRAPLLPVPRRLGRRFSRHSPRHGLQPAKRARHSRSQPLHSRRRSKSRIALRSRRRLRARVPHRHSRSRSMVRRIRAPSRHGPPEYFPRRRRRRLEQTPKAPPSPQTSQL